MYLKVEGKGVFLEIIIILKLILVPYSCNRIQSLPSQMLTYSYFIIIPILLLTLSYPIINRRFYLWQRSIETQIAIECHMEIICHDVNER